MNIHEIKKIVENFVLDNAKALFIFEEISKVEVLKQNGDDIVLILLVKVNDRKKLIFKIALDDEEILKYEYAMLQNLPEEFGPHPLVIDINKKILPFVFFVTTFVKGKTLERFFEMHLILFARKLADLHKVKLPFRIVADGKRVKGINLWEYFVEKNGNYFNQVPELMKDTLIEPLLPIFQQYLFDSQELFASIEEFSLIHGDLRPQNIVFDERDVKLINWGKAEYSDNARDLVTFFYEGMWFNNWRVKLDKERREIFLTNYLRAYWSDATLSERVGVWMVFDMFCSLCFVRWKFYTFDSRNSDNVMNKGRLREESEELARSLRDRLDVDD